MNLDFIKEYDSKSVLNESFLNKCDHLTEPQVYHYMRNQSYELCELIGFH